MKRREFIKAVGGVAALPLTARAQQGNRVRRIGVLMGAFDENDAVAKTYVSAFIQALVDLGWTDGHNVRIDARWPGGDVDRSRKYAAELVALEPDVIMASSTTSVAAPQGLLAACRSCSRASSIRSARGLSRA